MNSCNNLEKDLSWLQCCNFLGGQEVFIKLPSERLINQLYIIQRKSCFQPRKAILLKLSGQFFASKYFPINWRNWVYPCHLWTCAFPSHTIKGCGTASICWFWECHAYRCPVSHAGNSYKLMSTKPAPAAAQHLCDRRQHSRRCRASQL